MQPPRPERERDRLTLADRGVCAEPRNDGDPAVGRTSQVKLWLSVCELACRR